MITLNVFKQKQYKRKIKYTISQFTPKVMLIILGFKKFNNKLLDPKIYHFNIENKKFLYMRNLSYFFCTTVQC